jgi:hypothetical protein
MADVTRSVRNLAVIQQAACDHLGKLAHVIDRNADVMPAGVVTDLRYAVADLIYDLGGMKACLRQIDGTAGDAAREIAAAAE